MIVQKFRQLRNAELGPFLRPGDQSELIVLAGPNGSGKSSILELLSYGLATRYSWQYYQSRAMSEHSFAVRIGLSDAQVDEIVQHAGTDKPLAEFATRERGYWFEVNMPSVVPPEQRQTNEFLHRIASQAFQTHTRKLGVFIRADRGYAAKGYNRNELWQWKNKTLPQHWASLSYRDSGGQYSDMYDFLVEQGFQYTLELGKYLKAVDRGQAAQRPPDPLTAYNTLLASLFPGYSFVDATLEDLSLKVQLPHGQIIPFQDLSSGEKEVFFILSFFLRNNIAESVVVIDEPELHLHPELARKLIQLMRSIKPQNQVWCATHSAELVDEAGRERTCYLEQNEARTETSCVPATREGAELRHLRDMFGYSGFVGISKKIVFMEGTDTSADRKTFSTLFGAASREVKIIPAGSWGNLFRINAAVLSLLQSDFARCSFFLIRDRDYLSDEAVAKYESAGVGRLFILKRYHIENYLLEESAVSSVLKRVYQRDSKPSDLTEILRTIARDSSAAFLRDIAISRFSELYQSEDFSIGAHSSGVGVLNDDGTIRAETLASLFGAVRSRVGQVVATVQGRTTETAIAEILERCLQEVRAALEPGSHGWKVLFPGKYLLQRLSTQMGLGDWPALQNLMIEELARAPHLIATDLRDVVTRISDSA
jgi:energy-coupling factor transporter ATP-binding protein EcfA2